MTLALETKSRSRSPAEVVRAFHDRVPDWSDCSAVANAAADLLSEHLVHPRISIFRYDAAGERLALMAAAPQRPHGTAVGTRMLVPGGALGAAIHDGTTQTILNRYVEPDFVRSLPGEVCSELVVPIRIPGRVLGAVQLEYRPPSRPTPTDEELVDLLTRPLAVALSLAGAGRAEAKEESARRLQQAATLAGIAERLAQSRDLKPALQCLTTGAAELIPGGGTLLLLRHDARQMLEVAAVAGAATLAEGELVPLEGTLPGAVLADARPRVALSLDEAEKFCPADRERGVRDALLVPLVAGGKTFGVLAVVNRAAESPYSPEDVELLQSLANQAGAIESLRTIGPLRQRISDSSMIAEVGRALTGTLGLDEVLALVVRAAEMLLSARCAAVALLTDERTEMVLASTSGTLRACRGQRLPVRGSLLGTVTLTGEPVITDCVSDDPRGHPHDVRQGPGVVVPLESRGRIRGVLLASRAEGAPLPSDADADALCKLAAYAAIAIDNAQLYEEQIHLSQALRAQTQELERAYANLSDSQERLMVSEKMAALGRITAGIAHEINSPLGSILNCLQLAHSYADEYRNSAHDPEVTPADHEAIAKDLLETLQLAEGATRKVAQFVRTIKGQTRTGEEVAHPFDPAAEVASIISLLEHELRDRGVTLQVQIAEGLLLFGDPSKYAVLLQNLVSNAVDAYEGGTGSVWIRISGAADQVVLEVTDNGSGIPEEIRGRIFDYLFTTKDIGQGTGLGLSMVHSIVTSHFRGTIDLRSEVGVGTTFVISLPAFVGAE